MKFLRRLVTFSVLFVLTAIAIISLDSHRSLSTNPSQGQSSQISGSPQKMALLSDYSRDIDCFATANHYQIEAQLRLEQDSAVIQGLQNVRYTNHSPHPLQEVVFRLYPNIPSLKEAAQLEVTATRLAGKQLTSTLSGENTVLTVQLPTPLPPGQSVELSLEFVTKIRRNQRGASFGRMGYIDDVITAGSWYPALSVYEAQRGWWVTSIPAPITDTAGNVESDSDPTYSETSLFEVKLNVPRPLVVVSNGIQVSRQTNTDRTVTYHTITGPMREQVWVASSRYEKTQAEVDGVKLNIWYYRDRANANSRSTRNALELTQKSLVAFNQRFGAYPYRELQVVQNPVSTGLEFPGLVLINSNAWNKTAIQRLVVHEVAHQWFYGLVGNNQVEHPWLDEGLATYAERVYQLFYADAKTAEKLNRYAQQSIKEFDQAIATGDLPDLRLNLPVADFKEFYGLFAYKRGSDFYIQLEQQLGQTVVYQALRQYVQQHRYEIATTVDPKAALEQASGKNLDEAYTRWIGSYQQDDKPAAARICRSNPS